MRRCLSQFLLAEQVVNSEIQPTSPGEEDVGELKLYKLLHEQLLALAVLELVLEVFKNEKSMEETFRIKSNLRFRHRNYPTTSLSTY